VSSDPHLSLPIERLSLADIATLRLQEDIVRGRLVPGETLTEVALSNRLGVGRGTIRTALFTLEGNELVIRAPYSNWRVAPLNAQVIWEIYTLREALEGLAARILAERATEAAAQRLQAAFARLGPAEAEPLDQRVAADLDLHRAIVELTGHQHLIHRYAALSAKMEWLYRWSEEHWPQRYPLEESHRPLVDALLSGSPLQAEAAVRQHIAVSLAEDLKGYAALEARRSAR